MPATSRKQDILHASDIDDAIGRAIAERYGVANDDVEVSSNVGAQMVEEMVKDMAEKIAREAYEKAVEAGTFAAAAGNVMQSSVPVANDDVEQESDEMEELPSIESDESASTSPANIPKQKSKQPDKSAEATNAEAQKALQAAQNFGTPQPQENTEGQISEPEGDETEPEDQPGPEEIAPAPVAPPEMDMGGFPLIEQGTRPSDTTPAQELEEEKNEIQEDETLNTDEQGEKKRRGDSRAKQLQAPGNATRANLASKNLDENGNIIQSEQSDDKNKKKYKQFADENPDGTGTQEGEQEAADQTQNGEKNNENAPQNGPNQTRTPGQQENNQAIQDEQWEKQQQSKIEDEIDKRQKELQKKEQLLQKLEEEIAKKKSEIQTLRRKIRRRYILMVFLLISGFLAALIFWLRYKNKQDKQKIAQLEPELKKQEEEKAKMLKPLKNERARIQALATQRQILLARRRKNRRS